MVTHGICQHSGMILSEVHIRLGCSERLHGGRGCPLGGDVCSKLGLMRLGWEKYSGGGDVDELRVALRPILEECLEGQDRPEDVDFGLVSFYTIGTRSSN